MGMASRAAVMMARLRPQRSERVPKTKPPSSEPTLAITPRVPTVEGAKCMPLVRKVGYMSCVPWEKEQKAVMRRVWKRKTGR